MQQWMVNVIFTLVSCSLSRIILGASDMCLDKENWN